MMRKDLCCTSSRTQDGLNSNVNTVSPRKHGCGTPVHMDLGKGIGHNTGPQNTPHRSWTYNVVPSTLQSKGLASFERFRICTTGNDKLKSTVERWNCWQILLKVRHLESLVACLPMPLDPPDGLSKGAHHPVDW